MNDVIIVDTIARIICCQSLAAINFSHREMTKNRQERIGDWNRDKSLASRDFSALYFHLLYI